MKFKLHPDAQLTSEKSVGTSLAAQKMMGLDDLCSGKPVARPGNSKREIQSRGSIYLQLGRKMAMSEVEKVIRKF